jgi:hypothetical protein
MNEQFWWYVARAGGLVSWWLISASVLWGLLLSTRITRGKPTAPWLLDLHRFLGGLALTFTSVHVVALVADTYAHFGAADILVPFASDWRPGAVAWGVVAFYVLIAVEVTSLLMRRIPKRWWRRIHMTSFGLFVVTGLHGFTAGSEAGNGAVQLTALATAVALVFLLVYRALGPRKPDPRPVERARAGQRQAPDPGADNGVQVELGDGDDRQRVHDRPLRRSVDVGSTGGVGLGPRQPQLLVDGGEGEAGQVVG